LTAGMSEDELAHHHEKAKQAANKIHAHIQEHHPDILNVNKKQGEHNRVTWTSQANDIKNLTGKEDKAQQAGGADVMVSKHNKYGHVVKDNHAFGASLKYLGKKSKVSLSNRGTTSLEKQLAMEPKSLSKHDADHDEKMHALFGVSSAAGRHKAYRVIRDKRNRIAAKEKAKSIKAAKGTLTSAHKKLLASPTEKLSKDELHKLNSVSASDKMRTQNQAKGLSDHLNSMSHSERKKHLINLFAPEHTHPTVQFRTNHDSDTDTHVENTNATMKNALVSEHHVVAEGRYLKLKRGTHENPGATMGNIEFRSKGRPAGGQAQGQPTLNVEAGK